MQYHLIHKTVHGKSLSFKVRKGHKSLNAKEIVAVGKMFDSQKVSSGAKCPIIFFRKPKTVAVQRCENRHTFKSKAFRDAARTRAKRLLKHTKSGRFARKGK